jgi:predicted anti-sigma-YlaC factor YlaD
MYSFIRQTLNGLRRKHNSSFTRRRRRRKLPLSTRQWLLLSLGIATLVGTIFILALYYQPSP